MASRIVSLCYRTKKTIKGEARPTMVAIKTGDSIVELKLAEVDHERDFAMGIFPTSYRTVDQREDISGFLSRHCKWQKLEEVEDLLKRSDSQVRNVGTGKNKAIEICTHVPATFEGLRAGDQVVMALGAGDPLAAMLFAKGKKHGVKVWRTPPSHLKNARPKGDQDNKENDQFLLLDMFEKRSSPFYEFRQPDHSLVAVAVKLRLRMEVQAQRIASGNRLLQWVKDQMYLFEGEEHDLNQWIEERCKILQRDDPVYSALVKEEKVRDQELLEAVEATDAWQVLGKVDGIGPRIAAGILCIGDIRRFMVPVVQGPITDHEKDRWEAYRAKAGNITFRDEMLLGQGKSELTLEEHAQNVRINKALAKGAAKMMAYCGLHTMPNSGDGPNADFYRVFARHKSGEVGNWSTDLRQAFYQFGEQLNKNPDYFWGAKLLEFKKGFYEKHPSPIACDRKLTKLFRCLELFFRNGAGIQIQPKDNKIASLEALQDWFDGCCSMLDERRFKRLSFEIEQWQEQIAKATVEGKTVKLFTPGHLLKMAKWRTLTRFCRWLFPELVRVMGAQIENQGAAA